MAVACAWIEPIALHQRDGCEVIRREFESTTELYDLVLYCLALGWLYVSPLDGPIERPLQLRKRCSG